MTFARRAAPTAPAALCAALLLLPLGACRTPGAGAPPEAASRPAAQLDGETITVGELDDWIRDQLFERETGRGPSRLYQVRSRALDRLLNERVLERAAAERGVPVETFLEQQLALGGGVDEAEVRAYFEQNQAQLGGAPFEDVSDQIRRYLETRQLEEVVAGLRQGSRVVVHLEAPRLDVAAEGPARGPADAAVTIVEFSDFQCPYCRRALPVVEQVLAKYPTQVRVVYRHLPLEHIHPRARPAAEASLCADAQERFWDYHDVVFENPRALADEDLVRYAADLGLDVPRFEQCLGEGRFRGKVDADARAAQAAGITGTPAFVVNGILLSGAQPASAFYRVIDAELAAARP